MAGTIPEEVVISAAAESNSERNKLAIYFSVAMRQLAEGRRSEAKTRFRRCADSPYYGWSPRLRAQAFADRMDQDEHWPRWLPAAPDEQD